MNYKIEFYKDDAKEWRWRIVASNGRIVATGGEGYQRKFFCKRGIKRIIEELPTATIEYL
jgi:uncharacterized protein YegP (UPF0339 family)